MGLFLWLSIQLLGLFQFELIRWRLKKSEDPLDKSDAALANALQISHVFYLFGSLVAGIACQPFI